MLAQSVRHSGATERPPDDPCFERPETAAELDAVIHIILFGFNGVAAQIFRDQGEDTAQTFEIAHEQNTEIERNKERLVRIDHDRVGFTPSFGDPFVFG